MTRYLQLYSLIGSHFVEDRHMNRLVWMVMLASLLIVDRDRMAEADEGFEALVGKQGRVELSRGRDKICDLGAGLYDSQWTSAEATADPQNAGTETTQRLRIAVPGGGTVSGEAKITADSGNLNAEYVLTPDRDVALNSLHVAANFDVATLAGGTVGCRRPVWSVPQGFW